MTHNMDSLIALLVASTAIFVMIPALYINKALSMKGAIIAGSVLAVITLFLALTL